MTGPERDGGARTTGSKRKAADAAKPFMSLGEIVSGTPVDVMTHILGQAPTKEQLLAVSVSPSAWLNVTAANGASATLTGSLNPAGYPPQGSDIHLVLAVGRRVAGTEEDLYDFVSERLEAVADGVPFTIGRVVQPSDRVVLVGLEGDSAAHVMLMCRAAGMLPSNKTPWHDLLDFCCLELSGVDGLPRSMVIDRILPALVHLARQGIDVHLPFSYLPARGRPVRIVVAALGQRAAVLEALASESIMGAGQAVVATLAEPATSHDFHRGEVVATLHTEDGSVFTKDSPGAAAMVDMIAEALVAKLGQLQALPTSERSVSSDCAAAGYIEWCRTNDGAHLRAQTVDATRLTFGDKAITIHLSTAAGANVILHVRATPRSGRPAGGGSGRGTGGRGGGSGSYASVAREVTMQVTPEVQRLFGELASKLGGAMRAQTVEITAAVSTGTQLVRTDVTAIAGQQTQANALLAQCLRQQQQDAIQANASRELLLQRLTGGLPPPPP
jgi:hypothetical protein